ncbi:uncharacterized protein [Haliotis asinina]|uniref:uncharacterized protein n=1 Tax=Haliotis asinina TaxID=109174 RepID=UPI003532030C
MEFKVTSSMTALIPATIGETECKIETEVVNADIPLLLSKQSLKKAGTKLDLGTDKAEMFNKPVTLNLTSSGHYCVEISGNRAHIESHNIDQEILVIEETASKEEKKIIMKKLHKQFGHASKEHLRKLIQNAGVIDKETISLIDEVCNECEICQQYKRQPPKPAVGLPLASDFNETVAVDLHQLEDRVWYVHVIDLFTRFSSGAIMGSKESREFVAKFLSCWISVHGAPKRLFSDNGGKFNSSEMRDLCENFNIEIKTTAAYSPWSNGLLERHNQTLTIMLKKVRQEQICDWETALSWALSAKNTMTNVYGFSAHQLVYSRNPNLPTNLTNDLPALDGTTESKTIGQHINTLHAMRQEFTKAESSERIRRALRKQIRPESGPFVNGEKVYYRRPDSIKWRGPATVIGQEGVVVFARHGGALNRLEQGQKWSNISYEHMDSGEIIKAKVLNRAGKATGKNKSWYNIELQGEDMQGVRQSIDLSQTKSLQILKESESECQTESAAQTDDSSQDEVLITDAVHEQFNVGKEQSQIFQYVGIEVVCEENKIRLSQQTYADNLSFIDVEKSRAMKKEEVLNEEERALCRSKVGQILWIARQSRPDVLYQASRLSSRYKHAKIEHLMEINKVIKQIKVEKVSLTYQQLSGSEMELLVFSDASFGNLSDGGSQGAYIIFISNLKEELMPICWNSKKVRRVVRSTIAAETLAMADGVDMGIFISSLYTEIKSGKATPLMLPLVAITDCQSLYDNLKSTNMPTEKRLRMEISSIKEMRDSGLIKRIQWVDTKHQLSDCLTKRGTSPARLLQVLCDGQL